MNRIDRLNAILIQLQGKPRVTIEHLVDRFMVSPRTIFRDIKSLIESGIPIGGDAGSGYFVVEGYHLPPVVFNKEEAAALLLGSKFIKHQADKEVVKNFDEAMHKVRAVLKYADKNYLSSLEENISVVPFSRNNNEFPNSYISTIQNALAEQRVLSIAYYANYKDQSTKRDIEPLGLVYYSGRWHLIAYCRLRKSMRDFRCDRITHCKLLVEKYDRTEHPSFPTFLEQMIVGTETREVIIRVPKKVGRYIGNQKYYYGFAGESIIGDMVEMKFYTPSYDFFARWLLMFGKDVTIISPDELQLVVEKLVVELQKHYLNLPSPVSL
ncbi:MAG: YafY family protein [Cyclobacteriaceae bacterium]